MKNGKYEVTEFIHIYSEHDGQLKIAKGTHIVVNGFTAIAANSVRFPARMLDTVQHQLKRIGD